jgi:hypothetical protein
VVRENFSVIVARNTVSPRAERRNKADQAECSHDNNPIRTKIGGEPVSAMPPRRQFDHLAGFPSFDA